MLGPICKYTRKVQNSIKTACRAADCMGIYSPIPALYGSVTDTFIRGFKEADFVKTMDFVDEAVEIAKAVQVSKSQC